jgi:hypothetical protein
MTSANSSNFRKFLAVALLYFTFFSGYPITPKAEIPMGADRFDSIKIVYSINGKFQNGRETFIQKEGKTYREVFLETKILANTYHEHTLEIDDGVHFYRINLINNTGIKLPSLNKLKKEMIDKNPHLFKSGENHPLRITPSKGMLDISETIQGKECRSYLHNNKIIFIWEDIILKEIWEVFGKTVKKAESLEIDGTIDDSVFQIPEGLTFKPKNAF